MAWTADPLAARREERSRLIAGARDYAERLAESIELRAALVAGSVARGDFNLWSDVDVVVMSDDLPEPGPARAELLGRPGVPRIEAHGYTTAELAAARRRRDRLVVEALDRGVRVYGEPPA